MAKYAPSTMGELVELKREFMKLTMESGEDPEEFISQLEELNRKMKVIKSTRAMDEEDVLIHSVASLPAEYDHLIPGLSSRIEATTNKLTLETLKMELREVFKLQQKLVTFFD